MTPPEIMSCLECRNRKLKCDRKQPVCGKCQRTHRECRYPERRIHKGTRRRDTKILEARLGEVERKLAAARAAQEADSSKENSRGSDSHAPGQHKSASSSEHEKSIYTDELNATRNSGTPQRQGPSSDGDCFRGLNAQNDHQRAAGQVAQQPAPPEQMQRELFQVYFDRIQECLPIIHQKRFYDALKLDHGSRPPLSLQYAMWTLAASVTHKYKHLCDILYQRARSGAHASEELVHGESFVSLYSVQCWHLIATFEAQRMHVARAWISTGKCVRLCQLMGLQHMDEPKRTNTPLSPEECIKLEEKRRIFWASFMGDRWASAMSGWPMTINESEILTSMPSSDSAFAQGIEEPTLSLKDLLLDNGASRVTSSFIGTILAVTLMCRNFEHIHAESTPEELGSDKIPGFWKTHRKLDNLLSDAFMCLPEDLRISERLRDPNAFFLNMTMHAATICLHRAAVQKLSRLEGQSSFLAQSVARCIASARAISTATRLFSQQDLSRINPWTGFCLYIAGLVYCHDLRLSHEPTQDGLSNVTFLLVVMKSIGMYQPITEYFTVQLEIELEAAQRGRNCKLGQGRILSSPGNQRCDTSESRSRNGDEDSQSRESNSVDEVGNMLSNLQLPQPMAGILLHRCPHDDASEIRSVKTVNDSSSNSSSPQGQEHVRIVGGPFAAGHKLPSNSPGTPFNNPSHYSVQSA
ncbi:fungal-specific transcription factor domain-containing protein [Leptodontidium sp. MPI-SDFR-AT-0119]|nr:fungal-specific transcription factor domain-containing protein [Leptodontidium sp. MPI-SDFR-AT-0119]